MKLIRDYFPYYLLSEDELYYPANFYFDMNEKLSDNHENYDKLLLKPPYYAYIHTVEDDRYFTIQYWLYYAHNVYLGTYDPIVKDWDHEHDWDSVIFVILNKNEVAAGPLRVQFASHFFMTSKEWNEVERRGTHPVAYVARGAHGAYPSLERLWYYNDRWEPPGHVLRGEDFNWYLLGPLLPSGEPDVQWRQVQAQPDPSMGRRWPTQFVGDDPQWDTWPAPWVRDEWTQTEMTTLRRKAAIWVGDKVIRAGVSIEVKVLVPLELWADRVLQRLDIQALWPGSDIDIEAIDPAGNRYRGVQLVDGYESVVVRAPKSGVWTIRIAGRNLPEAGEQVRLLVTGSPLLATKATIVSSLQELIGAIRLLPQGVFKNNPEERRAALSNKLTEVVAKVEGGTYEDAARKLANDVRVKLDLKDPGTWVSVPVPSALAAVDQILSDILLLMSQ